nr:hypothetical protein [uncultured Acetobacter sp.]
MQAPSSISWLVDAVGEEAALEFIEANAGKRLYIPQNPNDCLLAELYGPELARAVCQYRGGEQYQVPLVKAWRVHVLANRGLNSNEIAVRTGLTWGRVSYLTQNVPVERRKARVVHPGQADLFG